MTNLMRCIDNESVEELLTVGDVYATSNNDGQLLDVRNNLGYQNTFVVGRFEDEADI